MSTCAIGCTCLPYDSKGPGRLYSFIKQHDDRVIMTLEAPGVFRDEVDVTVQGNRLKVTCPYKVSGINMGYNIGSEWDMDSELILSSLEAKVENGIITITVQRTPKLNIEVK